jgi:DNA-binding LytR/AlgR family response regulator
MYLKRIIVSQQDYVHFIKPSNILLCQSDNCYTYLHLEDGKKLLIVKSLTKFHKELPQDIFIRVNQSYVINKHFINCINKKKKCITLENCINVPYTITLKELFILIENNLTEYPP